jgi:5-methylcytosine-specific restriction endonuclease McrA
MSEQRDRRIRSLLERGDPKVRIAEDLGITRETVSRVAARLGYPAQQRAPDALDWREIRAFYQAGHTAAATQRHFGFGGSTWRAAIARGEISPRPRDYPQKPKGKTRAEVGRLHEAGNGVAEIAQLLGIAKPTVCYHLRKLGVPARQEFARRHDWDAIARAYEVGMSMRECKRQFGFSSQAWYDAIARGDIVPRDRKIPLADLLVKGRPTSRAHLKARLIAAGLKQNRCEICGITQWMGKPVNMQLHHENGDGSDNRIENLQFLCGTCHSQTDTYGGRNGHRRTERHLRLVQPPPEAETNGDEDVA